MHSNVDSSEKSEKSEKLEKSEAKQSSQQHSQINNWRMSVTVAAVIARFKTRPEYIITIDDLAKIDLATRINDIEFLMIEEETRDGILINQPAGHLEAAESPLEASIREALEETAHHFIPNYFLGTYLCKALSQKDMVMVTYLRMAFAGHVTGFSNTPLDQGILRTFWLDYAAIKQQAAAKKLRSPLVLNCIQDYLNIKLYPLDIVTSDESIYE